MKRYVLLLTLVTVAVSIGYLWYLSYKKIVEKQDMEKRFRQIPELELNTLEGASILLNSFDDEKNKVIIYFNTRCDFCRFEIKELEIRLPEFRNTQIILVSSEPIDSLRQFNNRLTLGLYPNAAIYHCPYDTLQKYFGKLVAPTIFIYGKNKTLLKKFKGATSIDDMLNVIEQEMINNGDHPMYE